ncbi:MAG: addiction module protein [Planctomycetaceae bacterium]
MSVSMKSLGLDRLTPDERIALAEELWESIAVLPQPPSMTDAQRADLERRLDAYRNDPQAGSSWEEVKARIRSGE